MEFLMRGGAEFELLYKCSFYNVSEIPLKQRKNSTIGTSLITILGIQMILYGICLVPIWSRRQHTCYKIMFAMGVLDILRLVNVGLIDGVLSLNGVVFCSAPTMMYIYGCFGMGTAVAEELMELLLAVNRCFYFTLSDIALEVFPEGKHWTWSLTAPPIALGILYGTFARPCLFSSVTHWWAWNPHIGYANELHGLYDSGTSAAVFTIHRYFMLILVPILYTTFFIAVLKRSLKIGNLHGQRQTSAVPVFFQSLAISLFQSLAAFLSLYRIGLDNSVYAKTLGIFHCCIDTQTSGAAPIVYLCCNKKIRGDVLWYLHEIKKRIEKKYPHLLKKT